jgi:hypothetical protein
MAHSESGEIDTVYKTILLLSHAYLIGRTSFLRGLQNLKSLFIKVSSSVNGAIKDKPNRSECSKDLKTYKNLTNISRISKVNRSHYQRE